MEQFLGILKAAILELISSNLTTGTNKPVASLRYLMSCVLAVASFLVSQLSKKQCLTYWFRWSLIHWSPSRVFCYAATVAPRPATAAAWWILMAQFGMCCGLITVFALFPPEDPAVGRREALVSVVSLVSTLVGFIWNSQLVSSHVVPDQGEVVRNISLVHLKIRSGPVTFKLVVRADS